MIPIADLLHSFVDRLAVVGLSLLNSEGPLQSLCLEDFRPRDGERPEDVWLAFLDRDGDVHRIFFLFEGLRIRVLCNQVDHRLADLDVDVASVAIEGSEIVAILVPCLLGVDDLVAEHVPETLLFRHLENAAKLRVRKHLVPGKIDGGDFHLSAFINGVHHFPLARRNILNLEADMRRTESLGVVDLLDGRFDPSQLSHLQGHITRDFNPELVELVLEVRRLDLLVALEIDRRHERPLLDHDEKGDRVVTVILDLDPHLFEEPRVPQSTIAVRDILAVQRVLSLQPQVIRNGVDRQGEAALDHDVTDDRVVLRSNAGDRNHHQERRECQPQSRQAPCPWVTTSLSLASTIGRSLSTHIRRANSSSLRFSMR